jgi:Cu2+-exporting ATPase
MANWWYAMLTQTEQAAACFHCGETVPTGVNLTASIDGADQPMCCPGCQAVARLIAGSGLESFYRLRTNLNEKAPEITGDNPYTVYDDPENCTDFVETVGTDRQRARLLLGGVSCAACTWLIESALSRTDGVESANVNLAQQSLSVVWDPRKLRLSSLLLQVLSLGYDPHPWQARAGAELIRKEQRQALRELAVAGLAMMQVGMFAIALHAGDIQGIALEYRSLMRWVSLMIATVVVLYSARSFFRNAWMNLRHRRLVMDLPVALAIGLAYAASAWATFRSGGQVYFDSISMFTFFLLLGRYLERQVRQRELLRQTDLRSLLPATCLSRRGSDWVSIATREVQIGDTLLLRAGEVIPADGTIQAGTGSVDEAAFSGEHLPRNLVAGDHVSAGTVLREGSAEMTVSAGGAESRLGTMLALMARAGHEKPALSRFADRVAALFVGCILVVAAVVAAWWWHRDPDRALWVTLSVLVVSCPCALALATPTALTAAAASLRRAGLLLVGEDCLETLNRCNRIIFDKTGTLTRGELSRTRVITGESVDETDALSLAAALEQQVHHPLAQAFADCVPATGVTGVEIVPGQGVRGVRGDEVIAIGSLELAATICPFPLSVPDAFAAQESGQWLVLVDSRQLLAWIGVRDRPRPEAAGVIAALRARGLTVDLLSGDSSVAGPRLAAELGIDEHRTGISPAGKLEYIQSLQASGEVVAMVGDGLNDAPVLAAADCAFAVNQATDLAKSRADAILLNPTLKPLPQALNTAARCRRIIRQNIGWALAYNGFAVPLAAAGTIPPWLAAIGMSASSLLVVLNSLRLK